MEDKASNINRLITELNKKFDNQVVGRVSDFKNISLEHIKTDLDVLNECLGGGFPKKRLVEIYGRPGGGKSLMSMLLIKAAQKEGGECVLIDVEDTYNPEFGEKLGVDNSKLIVVKMGLGEQIMDTIFYLLKAQPSVIVVDSVAAMVAQDEMKEDADKQFMALKARLMSKALPRINVLNKKTCVVFINQIRDTLSLYGGPTTPGGNALPFYASIRIEVKRSEFLFEGSKKEAPIGQGVVYKIVKNKTADPQKTGSFRFYFDGEVVEPGKKRKNEKT